jgi:hypothetical protein
MTTLKTATTKPEAKNGPAAQKHRRHGISYLSLQDYERIKRGDLPVTIDVRLCTPLTAGCETKRDRGVCGGYITVVVGVAFLIVVLIFG